MKKIYIGCSLTQAPQEFKFRVGDLKNILRKDFQILDFVGLVDGTPADVYLWDIHECVAKCDVFVAICDYPAIGLGYEIGVAVEQLKKPTLALAHKDAIVTRLLQGIELPHYKFVRYNSVEEIPKLINDFLKHV